MGVIATNSLVFSAIINTFGILDSELTLTLRSLFVTFINTCMVYVLF